ncbi:MAG: class I SAM-dependent methyltransferase [Armatimonadetes bacterium]|nr:class I SAM-dependent methyltransferase [Armatimonadota bacterium]
MKPDPREQFGREAEKYLTSKAHDDPDALLGLAGLLPGTMGRSLDVGAGAGHMAFVLAPRCDVTVALDPTPAMLQIVRREAQRRGLDRLVTVQAFAERLPFQSGVFDAVTCRVAAHHFDGPEAFVHESARVLAPKGAFLLVDTVAPDDDLADEAVNRIETVRDPSHRRNKKVSEWESLARSAGLDVVEVHCRPKPLVFQDWMDRMSVAESDRRWLTGAMESATGPLRDYLSFDGTSFHLTEMTLSARKAS